MQKVIFSSVMIVGMLLAVMTMILLPQPEPAVEARIVRVQRGDVHQTVALSGRMSYADERILYAKTNGQVEKIYVSDGERIGTLEAVVRLKGEAEEWLAASATATVGQTLQDHTRRMMEAAVIRADSPCTVREVYVKEQSYVTTGMPVARVSSHQQEILCIASSVDSAQVRPDMWAWLSSKGKVYGIAKVISVSEEKVDADTGIKYADIRLQPDQHLDLMQGEKIQVDVYIAGSDDVMTLPVEAVTERNTVWWVNEGRCTEIPAEIVMSDEMLAWVGLPEGISIAVGEFHEGQSVVEACE